MYLEQCANHFLFTVLIHWDKHTNKRKKNGTNKPTNNRKMKETKLQKKEPGKKRYGLKFVVCVVFNRECECEEVYAPNNRKAYHCMLSEHKLCCQSK